MNRIYQGKVTKVELPDGKDENGNQKWKPLDNWQATLWRHHELFQDAVNYYTLALAAMTAGIEGDSSQTHALLEWVAKVKETWSVATRKSNKFEGPQIRLASYLKLTPSESTFEQAAARVLSSSRASSTQRVAALLQLLEEANQRDLNVVCGERIAFLCPANPKASKRPTSKAISSVQELQRQQEVRRFHGMSRTEAISKAGKLKLELFLTQPPRSLLDAKAAVKELQKKFDKAAAAHRELKAVSAKFAKFLDNNQTTLKVPPPGRKPSGLYPVVAVFKYFPCKESYNAFIDATKALADAKDKTVKRDAIAEARVDDKPHFDYFTNLAFVRAEESMPDTRAVWFEFDREAFIEAIKAPHRYFEDTIKRKAAVDRLQNDLDAINGKGRESSGEDDEGDSLSGFEGDVRIDLIKSIVQEKLAWFAEAEGEARDRGPQEYTIRERTLRGFADIKKKWLLEVATGTASEERLLGILATEQAKHQDDFGSATFYRELTKPEHHPIWRDGKTRSWHADDPLTAWLVYKELQAEISDKDRPIRFTPAHVSFSPRYFNMPKLGRYGLEHETGQMSFVAGTILRSDSGFVPSLARIYYSAPRLCRDNIRTVDDKVLDAAPWVQPMMSALGMDLSTQQVDFSNCSVTLQPSNESDIHVTFPLAVSTDALEKMLQYRAKWDYRISGKNKQMNFSQFNYTAAEPRSETSLRWPSDIQFAKEAGRPRKTEPTPWHKKFDDFSCVAVDLGQRDAGAFARLMASSDADLGKRPSRFIGETGGKQWRATVKRTGLFRLPGEDAQVWRRFNDKDENKNKDSGELYDFREELWGERGRQALPWEGDVTAELLRLLEVPSEDKSLTLMPDSWRDELTFPEQNDKLLIAMRRYQSRIARLHRWCWFLKGDEKQQQTACDEINECEDARLVTADQRARAAKRDPRLVDELTVQLRGRLEQAPKLLVRIANRILPLRGRSWNWERHPLATGENALHQLVQSGPDLGSPDRPVWIRGQRGLSTKRIEQIEELRKRFQSLNQTVRRAIGGKPPIRRDESVPDPCPDLLEKLDNIKEQRVNQTSHMILAEALGLHLAPPPADKKKLRKEKDQHGIYQKILDKVGKWIGPVDFIVIEDLSRYRASQGRAPRENSRLMKWCHRAVRDKLKQLCEVFGLPVLETPVAYSSRFCSRSGVPGFRAVEVTAGFTKDGQWAWLAGKKDEKGNPTDEAKQLLDLDQKLTIAQEELERRWTAKKRSGTCPKRTLFAPSSGGSLFIPVVDKVNGGEMQPSIVQADINAAINLGLRAIADPRLWSIHPRLRTQRNKKDNSLAAREKRKFGEKNPPTLVLRQPDNLSKDAARQPNFFADMAGLEALADRYYWLKKEWISAEISDGGEVPPLLHSKTFWGCVKTVQWDRVNSINEARLSEWGKKIS